MHIIPEVYRIERSVSVVKEDFSNNKRKWELVDSETETAFMAKGRYTMINKSESRWKYYKTKTNLKKDQHFMIDAHISMKKNEDSFRHFGLVWGFDDDFEYFNRFTISADGKRTLVMHFEKDHSEVFHRFQTRKNPVAFRSRTIRFTIVKMGEYLHFSINGNTVYAAHEYHFARNGSNVGFYVEPGLEISSSFLEIKKLKLHQVKTVTGLQQLMNGDKI